jgi:hypothetical protein
MVRYAPGTRLGRAACHAIAQFHDIEVGGRACVGSTALRRDRLGTVRPRQREWCRACRADSKDSRPSPPLNSWCRRKPLCARCVSAPPFTFGHEAESRFAVSSAGAWRPLRCADARKTTKHARFPLLPVWPPLLSGGASLHAAVISRALLVTRRSCRARSPAAEKRTS